jgi:hypothetical protein
MRRDISGESPDVGDAGDIIGAAVDDVAVAIAGRRHELRDEAPRNPVASGEQERRMTVETS